MDRNSAIGLTLIAALLLGYFYWFSPKPDAVVEPPPTSDPFTSQTAEPDTASTAPVVVPDSILALEYGVFSSLMKGTESFTRVETEDIIISFRNKGGIIRALELKGYRT